MFCKYCGKLMTKTYRFLPNGKAQELYKCDWCYAESKPVPLKFNAYQKQTKPIKKNNKKTNDKKDVKRKRDKRRK